MKILRILILACLALVALAAGVLVYQRHAEEASRQLLRRYHAAQRRLENERVAICEKRRGVPLEPSEVPPLRMTYDGKRWNQGRVRPPVPIHGGTGPLGDGSRVGKFVVEALIDEAGCVRQVKILQSTDRSLDAATVATFEQWAFLPAIRDHRPVRVIDTLTLDFPPAEPWAFRDRQIDEDGYPVL
jgi:TonB family protein